MKYKILFSNRGRRTLLDFALPQRQRLLENINKLDFPFPPNLDVKKLNVNEPHYRLRVGDLRVILEIDHKVKTIWVLKIGFRGAIYKNH